MTNREAMRLKPGARLRLKGGNRPGALFVLKAEPIRTTVGVALRGYIHDDPKLDATFTHDRVRKEGV